ncbi:hypothetical protein DFJ73DRAFT_959863 [Zopfochytrium polystomum]|nr:hypothetical protein DFJ73DRAFT_959863 [Zopfochytrium polystomum]
MVVLSISIIITTLILAWGLLLKGAAIRYGSTRGVLLGVIAWLWGVRTHWIDNPAHARLVLQASNDKGQFIERLFATPAWAPVLSLESVDGAQWQRMKKHYLQLAPLIPPTVTLQKIVQRNVAQLMADGRVLDAPTIAKLTVASFFEWMFARAFDWHAWQFVADATWEWRQEIAMKSKGDVELKQRLVAWFLDQVRDSRLYAVFGEKWRDPECFSCYVQPFLISPAINVCDIAVAVTQLRQTLRDGAKTATADLIYLALQTQNPFPVLERFLPDGLEAEGLSIAPNTQAFIALDDLGRRDLAADPQYRSIVFGSGPRSCPGKFIALSMMTALFSEATLSSPLWQPTHGHRFSGRNNDGRETPLQVVYLAGVVARTVACAAWQRCRRMAEAWRPCPVPKHSD